MEAAEVQQAFGQVIRELRLAAGLSQEELSFACGIHRTYVSIIERGKNSLSLRMLWTLAEALGVPASLIIQRAEERLTSDQG